MRHCDSFFFFFFFASPAGEHIGEQQHAVFLDGVCNTCFGLFGRNIRRVGLGCISLFA